MSGLPARSSWAAVRAPAAAGIVAAALAIGATPIRAETSSWQQRMEAAPKPVQPKALPKPSAKVQSRELPASLGPPLRLPGLPYPEPPKSSSAGPLGPSTSSNSSTHAKASTDPAYEAFEEGKFLTALELAEKAAATGEPQAHTLIGRIHAEGLGVAQSDVTAAKWFATGAELGDIEAAFLLGVLHAKGGGLPRNYPEAARFFEMAAAKEHPLANYNLGLLFLRGQGKTENPHRAFAHIRFAAWRGVPAAQYDLGTLYATGTGTEANAFEAARWIERAAVAGHAEAEIEFAVMLFKVDAPPGDATALAAQQAAEKRGARLFRSAADKGYPVAQNRLARCYAYGKGVAASPLEAAKWHLIAKAGGLDDEHLEGVLKKLSRTDRLKAEQQAQEWLDRTLIQ